MAVTNLGWASARAISGADIVPIKRLVSYVDADDAIGTDQVSLSVRFEAELDDGRLVLLLDDRGWSSSGTWSQVSSAEIEETTRVVVGPDEPHDDGTWEEAETSYWDYIREILAEQGVEIDSAGLRSLPHDVIPSARLLGLMERSSDGPQSA
jgi:hypothetical protein